MLAEIEAAISERLKAKLVMPSQRVGIDKSKPSLHTINLDQVLVGIESGTAKEVVHNTLEIEAPVYVLLSFARLASEEARRKGIYPFVLATISYLQNQKLGLDMKPLKFQRFENISSEEEASGGLIRMSLLFNARFQITAVSEEEADELVTLGLNYRLKPGDETVDMQSEVSLGEEA